MNENIPQYDGNETLENDDDEDETYKNTDHYWKRGWLGSAFQNYIDALSIIESFGFDQEEIEIEKEKLLNARKLALGDYYEHYPPWGTSPWNR